MTESIDRIYARALMELADESDQFETVSEQLKQLGELVKTNDELHQLLDSRILSTEDRAACIQRIFQDRVDDLLYRFLLVVNNKNRLSRLPTIVQAFDDLENQRLNVAKVDIWTAGELPDGERDQIAARLGEILGKTIILHQHTDPGMIGGLKIRIGDQEVDGSVATQLRMVRQNCVTTGREHARVNQSTLITD